MAAPPYTITVTGPVTVNITQEMPDMASIEEALTQLEAQNADSKQDVQTLIQAMQQLLTRVTTMDAKVDIAVVTLTDLRNHTTDPALLERIANGLAQIQETDMGIEAATAQATQAGQQLDAANQRLTQAAAGTTPQVATPAPTEPVTPTP